MTDVNDDHSPQNSPLNSALGQTTVYPTTYAPEVLYAITRALGRANLTLPVEQLSIGVDWWQAFEVSWLNPQGVSQVAMARLTIPADSPYLVESKSLKLYLNSLNFTTFANHDALITTIAHDVGACVQAAVAVELFAVDTPNSLPLSAPQGICIDHALDDLSPNEKVALVSDVDAGLLRAASSTRTAKNLAQASQPQAYYSHLLRSNCPVTNQPDWGTVAIEIDSAPLDTADLLRYILSFRAHNGFHEQCVEQIFNDLTQTFAPKSLLVRAWYTRRGGIDINPCRVSDSSLLPAPSRLNRQ